MLLRIMYSHQQAILNAKNALVYAQGALLIGNNFNDDKGREQHKEKVTNSYISPHDNSRFLH